jgi:glutaminyl-tRNA synthetase
VSESVPASNFIRQIVEEDLRSGRHQQVVTRFPPEPNGFLHIGHAKAICLNFGLPREFGGRCHLRMDDTNPLKEKEEYVQAMIRDIRWLGFDWGEHFYYASDYFDQLYQWAKLLVERGLAYVDEQDEEQIRLTRGTVETPGTPSPWRDRPAAESLDLLEKMARGEVAEGAMVLRAKIDMAHPNMKMRDPLMYRILHAHHYRAGDRWHIYPLYDWAHGQSDALEGITHSLCSLEFDVNRELYDWYLEHLPVPARPHQYEFARLAIEGTMMSKRNLLALVEEGHVAGWDDPRMPTLAGMRRRGIPPAAIRTFVERLGVSKANSVVEPAMLDNAVRDELNVTAPRVLVVLDPIELVIEDWPEERVDSLEAAYWPHDVTPQIEFAQTRKVPLGRRVWIEREDFAKVPPKGYKRLAPGRTVRLRHGVTVTCTGFEEGEQGQVARVRCTRAAADTKVSATIHWVSAADAVPVTVRLYEPLFLVAEPGKERDFRQDIHPGSLKVVEALAEPSLRSARPGDRFQFERQGFFCVDPDTETAGKLIFNRVVPLKDSWAKAKAAADAAEAPTEKFERPLPGKPLKPARELGETGQALLVAGMSDDEASVLESDPKLLGWYHAALAVHPSPKAVASWVVSELPRAAREIGLDALPFGGAELGRLVELVEEAAITSTSAKTVLEAMARGEGKPDDIVTTRGLRALTDRGQVEGFVAEVLAAHPDRVAAYKGGRTGLVGFFVGQVIQKTGGRAEPTMVRELLEEHLAR